MKKSNLMLLLALPIASWSQTASISGSLYSFDVVNFSGQDAHGFELQIEGALSGDLYYSYSWSRYGAPTTTAYATGIYLRYQSKYDSASGTYLSTTPKNITPTFQWQDCYSAGAGYATSGCEHFGTTLTTRNSVTISGRWLVDDLANHGSLIAIDPPVTVAFPTWTVTPGTVAPAVATVVVAPTPAPPARFGDAQWVKIFKTELPRSVGGDELVSGNAAAVPEDPTQVETAWDILQTAPPGLQRRKNRSQRTNSSNLSIATGAVVRRYELYKYTGTYDALTHEVTCADLTCTAPSSGELGVKISAQNSAANVIPDTLNVTKDGSAAASSIVAGGSISCGNVCAVFAKNGATVNLTANPGGNVFTGWSGACGGTSLTCSASISGKTVVNATFQKQYTLSVGRSNPGTVVATPSGNDRALNCGGNCSAKFTDQSAVILVATPPDGKTFSNWAGACSGTSPMCTVVISGNTSVQAVFGK